MSRNERKRSIVVITKFLSVLIFFGGLITVYSVPRGSEVPWGKNDPGSVGNVNLFTGTLDMSIPLVSVGGRGGVQVPIILRLSENRWRKWIYYVFEPATPAPPNGCKFGASAQMFPEWDCGVLNPEPLQKFIFPTYDSEINLGYKSGKLVGRTQIPEMRVCSMCADGGTSCGATGLKRGGSRFALTFYSPDGSSHELVDKATKGAFNIYPDIYPSSCDINADPHLSRGNEFVSTDATGMTFISDAAYNGFDPETGDEYGNSYPVGMYGILHTADGTTYRIDAGDISWIKDRNGNITSFTYYANSNRDLHTVTDSIGRTVTIEYDVQEAQPYGLSDRINYKGFGNNDEIIRVSKDDLANVLATGETIKEARQLFPATCYGMPGICGSNLVNPKVTSKVWLPDGRSYQFKYTSFVEVARVELPTGSAVEYSHDYSVPNVANYEYYSLSRKVTEKRTYLDASNSASLAGKTKYSRSIPQVTVDQTDASDNLVNRTVSYFNGTFWAETIQDSYGPDYSLPSYKQGFEYRTDSFGSDGTTMVGRVLRELKNKSLSPTYPDSTPADDPRLAKQAFITIENGNALAVLKKTEYDENGSADSSYFSHLNVKGSKAYYYKVLDLNTAQNASLETIAALFSESDLASISETEYLYHPDYKARSIHGLPSESRILNPSNPTDVLAKSQFAYDEAAYFDNSYTTTNWENPNSNLRGNATTTRTWHAETNSWIESHAMFDNLGNVRKVWDTSGDPNRYIETQYSSERKYAYPTRIIAKGPDPTGVHGTAEDSEISRVFDFNTGLLLSVTDANGQTATTEYDNRLRPIRINPPAGGSVSETIYNDTPGDLWVKSRQQIDENNWAESTTYFDNLGRAVKTRTKDLQGDVMSQVKFDSFGRVEKTSNPYRVDASGNPTEPVYWSKIRYDEQNRVVETFAPALDGQTGISLGTVQFGISTLPNLIGTYVVATDASGRKSRAISGIYGLTRVDEATGKGGTADQDLGTLANPTQPTYYSYNIKGELTKITQGDPNQQGPPIQYRYFMYDSLGRLIRVRQPEQVPNPNLTTSGNPENNQWTAGYSYDVLGNVVSVIDAKDITITNFYDKAGRTITRTYSDGTPQVEYFYDGKGLPQAPQFSKGALTKVTSTISEDRFTSFDNHGRLLASQQITDGQTYNFGYKYNLSGGLIEETYPSGRIVRNFLDGDGGLSLVNTKAANGLLKQVASDFDYSATGSVKKMKLGNGLWETAQFNELQQLTQVGLGTTQTNNSLFKIDYEYGELNADGSTVDAVKNTGIIAKTTTTIPTTSFAQTYKYDAINRLTEAKETTNGQQNWIQTFGYDRFGNRKQFSQTVGSTQLPINNITHPTIDQTNNRFTTGQGYIYDFNGNLIQDAEGRQFTFNGDDKQTEVRDAANSVIGQYSYDGSGARVKKYVPSTGETTIFVYDAGGALAAEYSTATPPTNPTTSYLTTDHLGSPRVITDDNGQVVSRRDFMPFGEELGVGVGPRTENLKYSYTGSDNIRKRFTGYEKDDETGLDFAEARMYQNKHGRFTAPDPLLASASATNPQTFNRYIYTGNNPINYTDPSGLEYIKDPATGKIKWVDKFDPDGEHKGFIDVTGQHDVVTNVGSEFSRAGANVGDIVFYNDNHTISVVQRAQDAAQIAADTGTEVQATQEAVVSSPAGVLAGLPSCPVAVCGSVTSRPPIQRLETGTDAETALLAGQIALDVLDGSEIPVVSQAASLLNIAIDASQGDTTSVTLGVASLIPGGGAGATGLKITRRLGRLGSDATRKQIDEIANTLVDKGYEITRGGGRGKEEYLKPLLGGRKGGSYVDITAKHPKYGTIRINTVDTLKNGKTPTARERRNAARIRKQIGPGKHLLLIPKRK